MMKAKKFIILIAVALVLVGLASLSKRRSGGNRHADVLGKPVLPGLSLNDVQKVVVRSHSETTELARVEGTWVATSKHDYPVDFTAMRRILLKVADLKVGQVARVNDEQRKTMKMLPPTDEAGGTILELYDGNGKELASLLMGSEHMRKTTGEAGPMGMGGGGYPDGRYVSTDGGKSVELVSETLSDVSTTTKDWLDTDLLNVPSADVMTVKITGPDREPISLKRPTKGKPFQLEGLTEDEELDTSKLYGLESALSYLRLADVADPALSDEAMGLDKPIVFEATTDKGAIYTLKIGGSPEGSSDRYVRIAAALTPAPAEPEKKAEEVKPAEGEDAAAAAEKAKAEEENAKAEAEKKAQERKDLEQKIADVNAKVGRWTYVLESYKMTAMTGPRKDLVKEKKKEEEKQDEAKPEPATPIPVAVPGEVESVKPAAKAPEAAQPAPKPEAVKVEPAKPEPKPQAAAKPEPAKVEPPKAVPPPEAKPETSEVKPAAPAPAPAPEAKAEGQSKPAKPAEAEKPASDAAAK